jgi:hypothetical protein
MNLRPSTLRHRTRCCGPCKTPCGANIADPCARCPLAVPLWGQFDCDASAVPSENPSTAVLVGRAAKAGLRWVGAGMPLVARATYRQRLTACQACAYWKPAARLGLGKCRAPGCGCTGLKLRLATERCPVGRWPASLLQRVD